MGLFIEEVWNNQTEGYQMGSSGVYESFTDNLNELFQSCQKEYGRCVSACFVDLNGKPKKIGWVFEKKSKFTDVDKYFIQHTWISIHEKEPETKRICFYKSL